MKKNNMLRIASVLLVAVLLSTCAISGAFARYTTNGEATDSARVAAFGIEVTATGNAFLAAYAATDSATDANGDAIANTVVGLDGADDGDEADKVVAPGTAGDLGSLAIEGTAEVAVSITKAATLTLTGWEVDTEYYCPIVITIGGTEYEGMDYDSAAEFIAAVEGAIEGTNATVNYAPNTTFGTDDGETNVNAAYSWAWKISGAEGQTDEKDTKLGKLANAPVIKLDVTVTVNQID